MQAHIPVIPVETVQVGGHTLTVRDLGIGDESAIVGLHTLVFGPQVDAPWLRWKYGQESHQGLGQAVGAWHGNTLVAFCGGVPRTLNLHGKVWRGLQLTDVMVHPQWRGILTRKGPFYHASFRFYQSRMGNLQTHPFQLGFGFPSQIHMRLAEKIGLAWDAGHIQTLHWQPAPADPLSWAWRWQEIFPTDADFDTHINTAWAVMEKETRGLTLGHRHAAYWRWRYVDRPPAIGMIHTEARYRYFMLRRPWSRRACSVVVMDLRSPVAHWLDWVGSVQSLPLAVQALRHQAAQSGARDITAWASAKVAQQLEGTGIVAKEVCAWLGVPCNSDMQGIPVADLNWWLMGGDTDFL